jgi:hypothetical protein
MSSNSTARLSVVKDEETAKDFYGRSVGQNKEPETALVTSALRRIKAVKVEASIRLRQAEAEAEAAILAAHDELFRAVGEAHIAGVSREELIEIDPDVDQILSSVLEVLL